MQEPRISVVTPTLERPIEVRDLLTNLAGQRLRITELILIDAAKDEDRRTEQVVCELCEKMPYSCVYIRGFGGTAIQRNIGIEAARGEFIAFIDDDIRLNPDFFSLIMETYANDSQKNIGGVAGFIENQSFDPKNRRRWVWYRRLRLFTTFEPGRYDYYTGYPINRYMQAPHEGIREIDFMGTNCALWRREVFQKGLRFDEFFCDYGVLEDAHFALRAKESWRLVENGRARCIHLDAAGSWRDPYSVSFKTARNYRYVFVDIVPDRTWRQEMRFWIVQMFDLFRIFIAALRDMSHPRWRAFFGKAVGIAAALKIGNRFVSSRKR